jgi:transposase
LVLAEHAQYQQADTLATTTTETRGAHKRRSISLDDRRRIVEAYVAGRTVADISDMMQIPRTTIHGIIRIYQNENLLEIRLTGGPKNKKFSDDDKNTIKMWLMKIITVLVAIKNRLEDELGVLFSVTTINNVLTNSFKC